MDFENEISVIERKHAKSLAANRIDKEFVIVMERGKNIYSKKIHKIASRKERFVELFTNR